MKGIAKLVDIVGTPVVGSCVIRHFKGASFVEVWSKTCRLKKINQIGSMQKMVVTITDEIQNTVYDVEGSNWAVYMNKGMVDVEKDYTIKVIGGDKYALFFGEPEVNLAELLEIKEKYEELVKKQAENTERLYTINEVAFLPLLLCAKLPLHASTMAAAFSEWKAELN